MKKLLALFLALTLLLSFAACNKDGNGDDNTTTSAEQTTDKGTTNKNESPSKKPNKEEKTTAEPFVDPKLTEPANFFKVVDVNIYNHKEGAPNTTASSGVTFIANKYTAKNQVANTIPGTVSVGSSQFVFAKTTLKEIVGQGWTLIGKTDLNQAVEPGKEANAIVKNAQNSIIKIKVINKTSSVAAAGDCVLSEVGIVKTAKTEYSWAAFKLGDTVTTDSEYAEVVNSFGNPVSVTVAEYYKGNTYSHCKATMAFEQKLDGLTYTVSIGYTDTNGTATVDSFIVSAK